MVFNECKVVDEGLMNIMFVFFFSDQVKNTENYRFFPVAWPWQYTAEYRKILNKTTGLEKFIFLLIPGKQHGYCPGVWVWPSVLCLRRFVKKSPRWLLSICVDFVTRKDTCISKRRENVSCKNIYLGSFQTTDHWNSTSKDLCQCANPLGQGSNNPLLSQWQLFSVHRTHVRSMAARSFQCAQGDSCF